jgi:signal transduction histidine kinase
MATPLSLPARLRARGPVAGWLTLATGLTLGGIVEAALESQVDAAVAIPIAAMMGIAAGLAWWWPLGAIALQLAVGVIQVPLDNPLYYVSVPIYAVGAVVAMAASRQDARTFLAGLAMAAGTIACVLAPNSTDPVGDPVFAALFLVGLPTLAGRMFQSRTRLNAELRERAAGLAVDRNVRAEEAAATERRRIAGELHDLVAHGVSGMVVQAGAARRLVAAGDARASEAILAVEEGGREALTELRRLLGVLRTDDHDLALAPQPSLARVSALVAQMRESGLDVQLQVEGERGAMSPGVDVAGYRVIEEALRSALRDDGGGEAKVTVSYGSQHVDLAVVGGVPGGSELVGLRERVSLYGGELVTARRGGTPGLRAHLPLHGAAT